MTEYDRLKELGLKLINLMKKPNCTDIKWNNNLRTIIQEISVYDNMCMFSTEQSLKEKNNV